MQLPPQEWQSKGTMRAKPPQDLFQLFSFILQLFCFLQVSEALTKLLLENVLYQLKRVEKTSSLCFKISCFHFVFDGVLVSYNSPLSQQTLQWACFQVSRIITPQGQAPSCLYPFTLNGRKTAQKTIKTR